MKNGFFTCMFLFFFSTVYSQKNTEELFSQLKNTITDSHIYDQQKLRSIDSLKTTFNKKDITFLPVRFDCYMKLYEAYKVFNRDSAYSYANRLQDVAYLLNDTSKIIYAKIKIGFILLSSGLFKETLDTLSSISINRESNNVKAEYYLLLGRFYYDLGDFNNNTYTGQYTQKGNGYMDSALSLLPPLSFEYIYFKGLKNIKSNNKREASKDLKKLLGNPDLSYHELAVTASTLSDIFIQSNNPDSAIYLLVQAAIADIKSSTKETAASFNLAQLLYKKGDIKNASIFINKAVEDAGFYGARQRKVQLSAILPLIEGEKVNRVEAEKKQLITYSIIITFLLLVVVALVFVVLRQVKKVKAAQEIITTAHHKEQKINQQLSEANYKLSESNKIKEEYTGYFFNMNSEFFAKIEKFKKSLEQKIIYRKMDEIIAVVNNINLKKEKEELLKNFDRVFLKLFPHFVEEFNALFHKEDQVQLKDNELLNTDLRIFALIRMGIHDSERIAQILEYSVNTINTYKTKIKNKSTVTNEEFEALIMQIKTA
ncbi:MAG: tetratricopeptide repeat protein [Chitinophagaceae bacterium]|nr:tetratricopeptide repeat protein [Chitinophagaceae bacterium]